MVNQSDDADSYAAEEKLVMMFRKQRQRIDRLEESVKNLESMLASLAQRTERQDAQLSLVLSIVNGQRADVVTEQTMGHHDIGRRYVEFLNQEIRNAADLIVSRGRSGRRSRDQLATETARLCKALFDGAEPDVRAIEERLSALSDGRQRADRLCTVAAELRQNAAQVGGGTWDFYTAENIPLDPERQEPWMDSPEGGQILFVVTPAYATNDRLYCKQQVRTISR